MTNTVEAACPVCNDSTGTVERPDIAEVAEHGG